ncbi:MAG: CCA tRNA nucleotidyltransferase [Holosporaceae bacterium]|jgi:hypothetical protein|nr:CCA tRNA nucleotidyltransferase [Holosporaceae bacterium]
MDCRKRSNHLVTEELFFILDLLEKHGHGARVVGGAVRNFLLGERISDVDMATTALPQEVISIFRERGISTAPIGIEHGTVLVSYGGNSYEITTLRKDVRTFGRRAQVEFTKSFEVDSCRRDFTINAIYMDKSGAFFDYHSGIQDIKERSIRFIGDAKMRITEDYLRILRYFRFVAVYGNYVCNPEYLRVIDELKSNVLNLSSERIFAELTKIFSTADSHRIVPIMRNILGELFHLKSDPIAICHGLGIYEAMSAAERIGTLMKFSNFPPDQLLKKYNLARELKEMISLPSVGPDEMPLALKRTKKNLRKFLVKYSAAKWCMEGTISESRAKVLLDELEDFCESQYVDFNLRAKDLSEYNLSNEELKKIMIAAREFWLKSAKVSAADCLAHAVGHVGRKHRR